MCRFVELDPQHVGHPVEVSKGGFREEEMAPGASWPLRIRLHSADPAVQSKTR
jgi:hypothetical protein